MIASRKDVFTLNKDTLGQVQNMLYDICGIHLTDSKRTMIQNRINNMLKSNVCVSINSFDELFRQIKNNPQVQQAFINSFTTNKTSFFREAYHFDDMLNRIVPSLLHANKEIKILCSASSSGEEPYSIAATCLYAKSIYKSNSIIRITATDIDTDMLEQAKTKTYYLNTKIDKVPEWIDLEEYFYVKNLTDGMKELRVKSVLRNMIIFKKLNLFTKNYPFSNGEFDIIFCRNVLIYFKQKDQEVIISKLHNALKVGGTLYLGHSEDMLGVSGYFDRLGNKTFVKKTDFVIKDV